MMVDYTVDEKRILSTPIGELSAEEFKVLENIFIKKNLRPPILVKVHPKKCASCNGKGRIHSELINEDVNCGNCGGSGLEEDL